MKKTYTINISGTIFHIDDDAFEKLQRYLHMLNKHFGSAVEGQEILQDIEARISELLIEKTNNKTEAVTDLMVDEVIARMGKPEDFMEQEEEETGKPKTEPVQPEAEQKVRRRLYRDGESRVLGGVCSGLAAYFNMDLAVMRIIFILLFFVMGPFNVLMYLILWIVVPKAQTTAQKLEMRGKEATVTNIAKSIKDEVNEVGENYNKFVQSKNEKGSSRLDSFGEVVNSVFRVVLRVLILILGVVLLIVGISTLIGFITTMAVGHSIMNGGAFNFGWNSDVNMATILNYFVSPGAYAVSLIAIFILAGIPILLILFIGTKLLFRYKTNNKLIGWGAVGLWIAALIVLIFVAVNQAANFGKQTSQTVTQKIDCPKCKTLYIEANDDLFETLIEKDFSLDRMKVAVVNGKEKLLGHPHFTIDKSSTDEYLLLIKKRARGKNPDNAQNNVAEITYNFSQKDSTIQFDPYYFLNEKAKWRNQEVWLTLKVPEGKAIYLDPKMKSILDDIPNIENMWDNDMVGKKWYMTANGLALSPKPTKSEPELKN